MYGWLLGFTSSFVCCWFRQTKRHNRHNPQWLFVRCPPPLMCLSFMLTGVRMKFSMLLFRLSSAAHAQKGAPSSVCFPALWMIRFAPLQGPKVNNQEPTKRAEHTDRLELVVLSKFQLQDLSDCRLLSLPAVIVLDEHHSVFFFVSTATGLDQGTCVWWLELCRMS